MPPKNYKVIKPEQKANICTQNLGPQRFRWTQFVPSILDYVGQAKLDIWSCVFLLHGPIDLDAAGQRTLHYENVPVEANLLEKN